MRQVTAQLNHLHLAPRKVRLVASSLKDLPAQEAEARLLLLNKRSVEPILRLLRSAIANAKNQNIDIGKLYISSLRVDGGPMMKRTLPRAMGRATVIQKKSSHVSLILTEGDKIHSLRYNIVSAKKEKKTDKKKIQKQKPIKLTEIKKEPLEKKPGFFQRVFRRKAV